MFASSLRKLAALLCAVALLFPLASLFAEQHNCPCGMSKDACFCALAGAGPGAHCKMGRGSGQGKCSMGPLQSPSTAALFASLDLHGWLPLRGEARPVLAPAGMVPPLVLSASRFVPRSPEPPPPRASASA